MKRILHLLLFIPVIWINSCSSSRRSVAAKDDGKIDISFVQVNDVFEIVQLENCKVGGMAGVVTIAAKPIWIF